MKRLLLLPLTYISIFSLSQEVPVVVPQSPQAASLSKYSEFHVSTFTEIPSILNNVENNFILYIRFFN
jgi:hypothetical protein